MSSLTDFLKLLGTIGGLATYAVIMRAIFAKYQIAPMHRQWRPLVKLDEAVRRSYDAHPSKGDPSRAVTNNNPLIWHFMALMQDARAGRITVYGKRYPRRLHEPIPVGALRDRNVSDDDYTKLTEGNIEWQDVSVGWWALRQHIRRVPTLNLR
jgi:hypothetical protein